MNRAKRRALAARFGFACGYCGTSETDAGASHTVDHFQPSSRGGSDDETNWVYACFACNGFKGDYYPQSADDLFLLKPFRDDFSLHLREATNGELEPLSLRGRFHIETLHLNRPQLIEKRLASARLERERRENERILRERDELEAQVALLMKELFGE